MGIKQRKYTKLSLFLSFVQILAEKEKNVKKLQTESFGKVHIEKDVVTLKCCKYIYIFI